jgi:hypothetical protein
MAFQPISTSNTFSQWITEKQRAVSVLNRFVEGGNLSTSLSNTNIHVGDDVIIGGNLNIGGFLILDDAGYNDLNVAGNVSVTQNLISTDGTLKNLNVLSNIASLNTTTLNVGTNANLNNLIIFNTSTVGNIEVTGDVTGTPNLFVPSLTVTQNVENLNVSSRLFVGSDVTVYGDLLSFLNSGQSLTLSGNVSLDTAAIDTLTVNSLIGTANTNIYNNIFSSNAFTSVQNTISEFIALSTILG